MAARKKPTKPKPRKTAARPAPVKKTTRPKPRRASKTADIKAPEMVVDLPNDQKISFGKLKPDTMIEIATWRGSGAPDENSVRMLIGASSQQSDDALDVVEQIPLEVESPRVSKTKSIFAARKKKASKKRPVSVLRRLFAKSESKPKPRPKPKPKTSKPKVSSKTRARKPNRVSVLGRFFAKSKRPKPKLAVKSPTRKKRPTKSGLSFWARTAKAKRVSPPKRGKLKPKVKATNMKRPENLSWFVIAGSVLGILLIVGGLNATKVLAFEHPEVGPDLPFGKATSSLVAIVPGGEPAAGELAIATINEEKNLVRVDAINGESFIVSTMSGTMDVGMDTIDGKVAFMIPFIGYLWTLVGQ